MKTGIILAGRCDKGEDPGSSGETFEGFMLPRHQALLRRLTLGDEEASGELVSGRLRDDVGLDARTSALLTIAALIGADSGDQSLYAAMDSARSVGVDDREILGAVAAIVPLVGWARAAAVAPVILQGLGELGDSE
jgi:alkylhydroperoxidase/carboxymuconolactone decarboxylase family protein YurZ